MKFNLITLAFVAYEFLPPQELHNSDGLNNEFPLKYFQ